MRVVSFFSGIEMASLAFQPLGWEIVAVAEVDPFACAVLAHYHPDVPNLGDVTKITDDDIAALGSFDAIIMGFPCQDLSHAGKRKGLRNQDGTATRSGLFFDAMRLVRAAHSGCGLRWLVLENVPGLFSSPRGDPGRDFAAVVGEIVGCTIDVPEDGWQDTGAAAGPRGMVEWSVLDAQWFGLAQRRERVFLVADFGAWADRPPVLLERESLSGHPPACVAARERPARRAARRTRRKSIWEQLAGAFRAGAGARTASVARTLGSAHGGADEHDAEGGRLIPEFSSATEFLPQSSRVYSRERDRAERAPQIAREATLAFGGNDTSIDSTGAQAIGFHARQDPDTSGDVTHPLDTDGTSIGIAFDTTQITSGENRCDPQPGDPCHPLAAHGHPPAWATMYEVRRLTPREAERLQGVPDDYTNIPYRGRNDAPDGPRYRALGNGFAVPVVRWIGERIEMASRTRLADGGSP